MNKREKYSRKVARLLLLVLAVLSLLQPFQKDFIIAGFFLNRSFIVENLCENLDRPELHCEGICQLKKSLQAAKEQQQEEIIQRLSLAIQFVESPKELLSILVPVEFIPVYPVLEHPRPMDPELSDIFKPPVVS